MKGHIFFRVPAAAGGFHLISAEFADNAELGGILAEAKKKGFAPVFAEERPVTTGQPPLCPIHGPMRHSGAGSGDRWFCPKRMANGHYCPNEFKDGQLKLALG